MTKEELIRKNEEAAEQDYKEAVKAATIDHLEAIALDCREKEKRFPTIDRLYADLSIDSILDWAVGTLADCYGYEEDEAEAIADNVGYVRDIIDGAIDDYYRDNGYEKY
ncbi:MAG: hypothetical protein J5382_09575 [Bacteroidales bacterium]|nr:hypothetical protein [Bacteroidales bacterium]